MSIFVSCRSDTEVVQKSLERYENVTAAKIDRNKSSDLRLVAWKRIVLPGPFNWIDRPVCIQGVRLRSSLQQKEKYYDVQSKVVAAVYCWVRRPLTVMGRGEAFTA